ncbi:uncharacterized protein LOC132904392 [Amyelois transitella]|uniref:uncharacterized protein LOC132904392 n=1 Tax=Amyelois transitella TaxID=680683 RepID=UPI00299076C1|nr:uncharacterized protein LOC132904392 [Amyelois transitella]
MINNVYLIRAFPGFLFRVLAIKMMRFSLLCLVGSVVGVWGIDDLGMLRSVNPQVPYSMALRVVRQANNRLTSNLVTTLPAVSDPRFHYMLVLGMVDATARRLLDAQEDTDPELQYLLALKEDLPGVYRNLPNASAALSSELLAVQEAVEPLVNLMEPICEDLDEKDCDMLVELQVERANSKELDVAVDALNAGLVLSNLYLNLHEELTTVSRGHSGLGYSLSATDTLSNLADKLRNVLAAAELNPNSIMYS